MKKSLKKQLDRFSVFQMMCLSCTHYLEQLAEKEPEREEEYEKMKEETRVLCQIYGIRISKKFHDMYGGPTYDEKIYRINQQEISNLKVERSTFEEFVNEYNILTNIFRCSIRFLDSLDFETPKEEKVYLETFKEYQKTYRKYREKIEKKTYKFFGKVPLGN